MGNIKISKIEPIIDETINIGIRGEFQISGICTEIKMEQPCIPIWFDKPIVTKTKCDNCMLENFPDLCKRFVCHPGDRKDGKSIIIKEIRA